MKHLTDADLAQAGVGVAHHFGGKAYIKETDIPAGASLTQHAHAHDHLAYLVSGTALVQRGDEVATVQAPACMRFDAGILHGVTAITPVRWLCVWGTDCVDADEVDQAVTEGR